MRAPERRAFSFVEVLVCAGILSVVLGILLVAFSAGGRAAGKGMATLDLATTAGLVSQHLKRDLRTLMGPVPLPRFEGTGDTAIRFQRFDGLAADGSARLTPVEYRIRKLAGEGRTLIVRTEPGERAPYSFDRDVVVMIGSDGLTPDPGRGVAVTFGFPPTAREPGRRSLRLDMHALGVRGGEAAAAELPAAGSPALAVRLQPLPPAVQPFDTDPTDALPSTRELFTPGLVAPSGAGGLSDDLRASLRDDAPPGPGQPGSATGRGGSGADAERGTPPGTAVAAGGAAGAAGDPAPLTVGQVAGGAATGLAATADQLAGQLTFVAAVARGQSDARTADQASSLLRSLDAAAVGAPAIDGFVRAARETLVLAARLGAPPAGTPLPAPPAAGAGLTDGSATGPVPGGSASDLLDPLAPAASPADASPAPAPPGAVPVPPPATSPPSSGY